MRRHVATTANGFAVSIENESHASTHLLDDTNGLWALTQEAIRKIIVTADDVAEQVDMGRVVGRTDLVQTYPNEPRIYALRPGRNLYVPFVEREERPEARSVVLVLKRLSPTEYNLFSTFVGVVSPGLPGGDYATNESVSYWLRHALVLGSQKIDHIYDGIPPVYRG